MIEDVTRGTDPEVFLKDSSGKFVSAIGKIGGTKKKPLPVNGVFIQEDNVLAEFNTPPTSKFTEFSDYIQRGKDAISNRAGKGINVEIVPYAFFDEDQLQHPLAQEAGCTPDDNCWTMQTNIAPDLSSQTLRTASGHIHIGYKNPTVSVSQKIAQVADLFCAVPSVLMSDETPRRELYGKMGTVRFKPYGVEYRTLSNFWLKSEELITWAWDAFTDVIDAVNGGFTIDPETRQIMEFAINDGEKDAAEYLVQQYNLTIV
jgi:hypothetical protein